MGKVDPEFVDLEVYAIYKAASKLLGERAWEVVWMSGETMFDEVSKKLGINETEALPLMRRLAKYLQEVGYVEKIDVRQTAPDELEYTMSQPIILEGARRLIAEGGVPAHFSTTIMFAGLKKMCGLRAEMQGDPEFFPDGSATERWKLFKV